MSKITINSQQAPQAIGTYSQAVKVNNTVYLSGQIPLDPQTMQLVSGEKQQLEQMFKNLSYVALEAGGSLNDIVKLNIYLTNMDDFPLINEIMPSYFSSPYPARAAIGVASLPKGALFEVDGIMVLDV